MTATVSKRAHSRQQQQPPFASSLDRLPTRLTDEKPAVIKRSTFVGTAQYISPEVALNRVCGVESDYWQVCKSLQKIEETSSSGFILQFNKRWQFAV